MQIFHLVSCLCLALALFWSPAARADIVDAADYNARSGGLSYLVVQDGRIRYEAYANGGSVDHAAQLASGTKSFVGIIAAAAVQDGLLSLSEPVAATLTEWEHDLQKSTISIRQLLQLNLIYFVFDRGILAA